MVKRRGRQSGAGLPGTGEQIGPPAPHWQVHSCTWEGAEIRQAELKDAGGASR